MENHVWDRNVKNVNCKMLFTKKRKIIETSYISAEFYCATYSALLEKFSIDNFLGLKLCIRFL